MKELRVGIVGTGGIAAEHMRSLVKTPGVSIVALADKDLPKAQAISARELGGKAACFADGFAMLAGADLDAMFFCIPPGLHAGEVEAAAAKGVHLFLEKPIALTMERAQSMAAAIHKSGVKCQVGHHMRHFDPQRRLKQMLLDGSAGRPLLMQAQWWNHFLQKSWWQDPLIGGGQLIEQAIHLYDLARYFFGDVQSVSGFAEKLGHARFPQYRVDDVSASTIRFRNGGIASICAANCADPWYGSISATILCEKVMVTFKTHEEAMFLFHDGMVSEEAWQPGVPRRCEQVLHLGNSRDEIQRNFFAAIRDNEPLRSSIDDGVEGLRLVLGVVRSSREGGTLQRF